MVLRAIPVSVCVAVISTPGRTAPLWSVTRPLNCAVDCAQPIALERTKRNNTLHRRVKLAFMFPPVWGVIIRRVLCLFFVGNRFSQDSMPGDSGSQGNR